MLDDTPKKRRAFLGYTWTRVRPTEIPIRVMQFRMTPKLRSPSTKVKEQQQLPDSQGLRPQELSLERYPPSRETHWTNMPPHKLTRLVQSRMVSTSE